VRIHRFHRPISFVLALALLLASTLGMVHGNLHAPGLHQADTTLARPAVGAINLADGYGSAPAAGESGPTPLHGWLLKLFDHHDGEQCRLYDQLSGSCALPSVPFVAAAVVLPTAIFLYSLGQPPVLPSALFEARAPPSNH